MIKNKEVDNIITHNNIPCSNGRTPTCFSDVNEIPQPIRNKVILNPIFDNLNISDETLIGIVMYVFTIDAATKNKMNQGNAHAEPLCLNNREVSTTKGMIHSARASLTVVAIANASLPYFAEAPTTELVS